VEFGLVPCSKMAAVVSTKKCQVENPILDG